VHVAQRLCGARPAATVSVFWACVWAPHLRRSRQVNARTSRTHRPGPVVSGKAYTRELRALQMASGTGLPETADSDVMEVTGFALSAATRTSLSAVDLSKLERAPASQVLILDRHDLPGNERWAAHLQASGATVERHAVPGYAEMMLSPTQRWFPRRCCVWRSPGSASGALWSRLHSVSALAPRALAPRALAHGRLS